MARRTDKQIFDQTNELARKFYAILEYEVEKGYRFDLAYNAVQKDMWNMACIAQDVLTDTCPEDINPEEFYPEGD